MFKFPAYLIIIYLFIPFLVINSLIIGEQQFVYLAYSFINGSFSLIHLPPTITDLSLYQGKFFWPLGPFPAVLLIPFVWIFKTMFLQGFIQFPLNILNFFLVYKISKTLKLRTGKAVLLAIFFIFGSVYTPIAAIPFSWYFAQVIATSLLLFAIYEFLNKKNYLVIGIALALATLTRTTLIVSSNFL